MQPNTILRALIAASFFSISACGGGGGGAAATAAPVVPAAPNTAPTALADAISLVVNTPTSLGLLNNDTDPDGSLTSYQLATNPSNGSIMISGSTITYTPNEGYIGSDAFTYAAVDNQGASSNTVTVSLTIEAITQTSLAVRSLVVPTSNYQAQNNADLSATILTSPQQTFALPPNTVSYAMYLQGAGIGNTTNGLFITSLADPTTAPVSSLTRLFEFCDPGFCSGLLPRRPDQNTPAGNWQFNLGTRASNTTNINFSQATLHLAVRTGPLPDLTASMPARLSVQPYRSATSVSDVLFTQMLQQFVQIGANNGIAIDLLTTIPLPVQYAEVSSDFNDTTTAEMVSQGAANNINIFFIESFSGTGGSGRLGIAAGIPGSLGVKGQYNGLLINAAATLGGPADYYSRTTAEFAFHEMGHLLGLLHTTEANYGNDVIDDTPDCAKASDANSNNVADISECADGFNPMFWTNELNSAKQTLTADQKRVIYYSPIAKTN